jgi:hypothetical protein
MQKINEIYPRDLSALKSGEKTRAEIEMPELMQFLLKNHESPIIHYNIAVAENRLRTILDQEHGQNEVSIFFNQSRDHLVFLCMMMKNFFESIKEKDPVVGTLIGEIKKNLNCGPSTKEKIFNDACKKRYAIKTKASWNKNLIVIFPTVVTVANFLQDTRSNFKRVTDMKIDKIHKDLEKRNTKILPNVDKILEHEEREELGSVWSQCVDELV